MGSKATELGQNPGFLLRLPGARARAHTQAWAHTQTRTHTRAHRHTQACRLTVGGQEGVGSILLGKPFDLVDFLLYLQALEIVELRLMALESAVDVILALAVRRIFTLQGNIDRGPEYQDGTGHPAARGSSRSGAKGNRFADGQ